MDFTANEPDLEALVPTEPSLLQDDDSGKRTLAITVLDHLLITELNAADACRRASQLFDHLPVAEVLRGVMDGHQHRALALGDLIRAHDGTPSDLRTQDSDITSLFSSDVRLVLALLLELEQRGVMDYRQALRRLDDLTRVQVEADLLPAQERSLATLAGAQPPAADGAV